MSRLAFRLRHAYSSARVDPSQLPGLVAWWRPEDLAGLTDGQAIASWTDHSAGITLSQATGTKQPVKHTASGLPLARFAAASQQILTAATGALPQGNTAHTVLIIATVPASQAGNVSFYEYAGAGNKGYAAGTKSTTTLLMSQFVADTTLSGLGLPSPYGVPRLMHFGAATGSSARMNVDNRGPANVVTISGSAIATGATTLAVGGSALYNQWYANADIQEIVVYNRVLSDAETTSLSRNYFRARYGLIVGSHYNGAANLPLATPDGSGIILHPDVMYDAAGGILGHKYWMAATPWPSNVGELPCVYVSEDNTTWAAPAGVTNPIAPNPAPGYLSDTDMIREPGGRLWVIYREVTSTGAEKIHAKYTDDGSTFSAEQNLFNSTGTLGTDPAGSEILSPAIVWNGTQYVIFSVRRNSAQTAGYIDRWTASTVAGPWTRTVAATPTTTAASPTDLPWHINVVYYRGQYVALLNDKVRLWMAASTDGMTWTVQPYPILTSRLPTSAWDDNTLYRSAFLVSDDATLLRIWYSGGGTSYGTPWRIGYTEAPISELSGIVA